MLRTLGTICNVLWLALSSMWHASAPKVVAIRKHPASMNGSFVNTMKGLSQTLLPFMTNAVSDLVMRGWALHIELKRCDIDEISLFERRKGENSSHLNWFSVAGQLLANHAIVSFDGTDAGVGVWTCMKDRESMCRHALLAEKYMREIMEACGEVFEKQDTKQLEREGEAVSLSGIQNHLSEKHY